MKPIRFAAVPFVLLAALSGARAETVPAPSACTEPVEILAKTSAVHRVNQSSVARPHADRGQTYWINSRLRGERADGGYKSKCVTGPDGQVVSLRVEQGYWK